MSETAILNKKTVHFDAQSESSSEGLSDQGPASAVAPMKGKQSDETIENLVALLRDLLETAPNPATSNHTHTQQNTTGPRKRLFGLTKGLSPETGSNNRYDYEQKYPRDRSGEEAAENARVWLTYLDEAESFDRERVEGWKDTADVLLVFAGLFSGVITAFISQASQSLQRDNTLVSASLLFEIAQILRAQSTGTPTNIIPNSTLTPTSPFIPSTNAFIVNGLWFTSLAITLSTALFAVLAKQWLYHYLSSINGTANERARARHLRYKGFELWRVGAIVDLLPILLHLAVGIFLLGIIILLFPLDIRVAWTILIITSITYTLYFISVLLPIRYPECPYTTSLTIYAGILFFSLQKIVRWTSPILNKGFQAIWRAIISQAVWRRIKSQALDSIQRLLHYIHDLSRSFLDLDLVRLIRYMFRTHLPNISTEEFPKFTKWREDNIKKAVKNAAFLDFEALRWLYETSPNRSVHRIIARCAAVHPSIGQQFELNICKNLRRALEVNESNVVDLRYGLCLDLPIGKEENWSILPDVVESQLEEAEYQSYYRIAVNVIYHEYDHILDNAIKDNLKLPLAMWRYFLNRVPKNTTVAAHILIHKHRGLFKWKFDPTREPIRYAGVVSLDSEELGWWKFDFLFGFFPIFTKPNYSLDKTFETRYLLLITIYRDLTSDQPLITDKEQRHRSLLDLFTNFHLCLRSIDRYHQVEDYLTFFIDICCADAFWSESMTHRARCIAAVCLAEIWKSIDTDTAKQFPFTEYDNLSLIYQWYSRDDLNSELSRYMPPMFALLLVPQNRRHLSTILFDDLDAVSHFSKCFQTLGNYRSIHKAGTYIYPNLMDLLKSMNPKIPLFTVLYDSSVLVQLWKLLLFSRLDSKKFFLRVKSKLDREKLDELYVAMTEQVAQSADLEVLNLRAQDLGYDTGTDILDALEVSVREFGQIIGISHSRLGSTIEQSAPEGATDNLKDHDIEERAQVPGQNERKGFHSAGKMFGSVWPKTSVDKQTVNE